MARLKRPTYTEDSTIAPPSSAPQAPPAVSQRAGSMPEIVTAAALNADHIAAQAPAPERVSASSNRAAEPEPEAPAKNLGDIDALPYSPCPDSSAVNTNALASPPGAAGAAGAVPPAPVAVQRSTEAQSLIVHCDTHRVSLKPLPLEIRSSVTAQQLAYALRYVETASRKQAYLDAGYSVDASDSAIYAVHQNARVQACIAHILAEVAAEAQTDDDWIDRQLVRLYREAMEPVKIFDKSGTYTGLLTSDRSNALKALELIGKKRGLFGSKVQHEHSGSVSLLLQAVAARGKPSLEQRQRPAVTVDNLTGHVIDNKGNPTS